ncbi:MAG: hypothetical protein VR68_02795 [Peptococcaceae bacterium BRH_c4a]|nr:MAG: hypothetical protein VR68_02795 [Peptococcaceae bacterium BRH_c4a]
MIDFMNMYSDLEKDLLGNQKKLMISSSLSVYYGINGDGNFRLSFMSSVIPPKMESTKLLKVSQFEESDAVYWTCFDLMQSTAKQVFYTFCGDIVSSVYDIQDEHKALILLKNRFHTWKSMFKRDISKITDEMIKGLLGELYFLREFMIVKYGIDDAIEIWSGPDGANKDFSKGTDWYEVKTVSANMISVKISSVTQLSSATPGHLAIIRLESMSSQFEDGQSSVGELFQSVLRLIEADETREKFLEKLISYGFDLSDDCCNVKYKILSCTLYKVDDEFPRIQETDVKFQEICKLSYELIINALERFREE